MVSIEHLPEATKIACLLNYLSTYYAISRFIFSRSSCWEMLLISVGNLIEVLAITADCAATLPPICAGMITISNNVIHIKSSQWSIILKDENFTIFRSLHFMKVYIQSKKNRAVLNEIFLYMLNTIFVAWRYIIKIPHLKIKTLQKFLHINAFSAARYHWKIARICKIFSFGTQTQKYLLQLQRQKNVVTKQIQKAMETCSYLKCNKITKQCEKFYFCNKCRCAYYCSRRCQKKDWIHKHKFICTKIAFRLKY